MPQGVTSIRIVAVGANGGGDNQSNSGGSGAIVTAVRPVDPGETISFYIGAGGELFGGGGSTNVNPGSQYQVIAGGGGGGVGAGDAGGAGGAGEAGGGPYSIGGGGGGSFGPSVPGYDPVIYAKAPRNGNGPGSNGSLAFYTN